ncbi:hypothetical protein NLG97_g4647 [Lecanicillium saksenae]|uniref:Uncharacterized protein n=1 Tax=Lecanicillium saksenae TaxID=468837 RepID=A0ACC1QUP7_9HYPO|nr:hypothetical protein NLG97_g4647 [Lecanicillium saksenae]
MNSTPADQSESTIPANSLLYLSIVLRESPRRAPVLCIYLHDDRKILGDNFTVTIGHDTTHRCDSAPTTDSSVIIALAKTWIDTCQKRPNCQLDHKSEAKFFPTRLIDVGDSTTSPVRLIESPTAPLEYLALSHCWGKQPMRKRLLQADLEAMKLDIRLDDLSQNFQDAISITRGIGVRYIWIDSLCIIQDSTDDTDWDREAKLMGHVYANSLCVLSATASAESDEGFFRRKIKPKATSFGCVLRLGSDGRRKRGSHSVWLHRQGSAAQLFDEFVDPAPLSSRAWAFQERVLARRVIHYCNGVVLFECNTLRASEYDPEGLVHQPKPKLNNDGTVGGGDFTRPLVRGIQISKGGRRSSAYVANANYLPPTQRWAAAIKSTARSGLQGEFQLLLSDAVDVTNGEVQVSLHNAWYEIVEQYSTRALTHETDRLIAITGAANLITARTNRTFAFGLWLETLAFNLLWIVKSSTPRPRASFSHPSWSWISAVGGVKSGLDAFTDVDPEVVVSLVSHVCMPASTAVAGTAARKPSLTLVKEYLFTGWASNCRFVADVPGVSQNDPGLHYLPIAYLCLGCSRGRALGASYRQQIHGIVLRPVGTGGEHERVGYFMIEGASASGVPPAVMRCSAKFKIVIVRVYLPPVAA